MGGRAALVVALFAVLPLAGCGSAPSTPVETASSSSWLPRVVVAIVDTGIQPYHEQFLLQDAARAEWTAALAGLQSVPRGALDPLDGPNWSLNASQLYYFEGTRVLAVSPDEVAGLAASSETRVYDDGGHGTMTASLVAQLAPNAFIVAVEGISWNGTFEWILAQDWIDLVVVTQGSPPLPWSLTNSAPPLGFSPTLLSEAIVAAGVPFLHAAGNDPLPTLHTEAGPPWVVAVGGADEDTGGAAALSRPPPDVVANWTSDHLASNTNLTGYRAASGTSFAAPAVAALLAEALYEARVEAGHVGGIREGALVTYPDGRALTQADFRAALNATARYWGPEAYDPSLPGGAASRDFGNLTLPVAPYVAGTPVGPWVQMGWGWAGPELLPDLLAALRGQEPPPKPPEAHAYMAQMHALREAYWSLPAHG